MPAAPAPTAAEVPEWLQEMAPAETVPPTPAIEAPPADARPTSEEAPPPQPAPAPALVEIPEWLQKADMADARPTSADARPTSADADRAPVAPPETETPVTEGPPEEVAPVTPALVLAEVPERLHDGPPSPADARPKSAEAVSAEPVAPFPDSALEESIPPTTAEIPDWLQDLKPQERTTTDKEVTWLSELEAEPAPPGPQGVPVFEGTTPSAPREPAFGMAGVEGLARAEIPQWLEALRPRSEADKPIAEQGPVETEGLLEGLRGVIAPTLTLGGSPIREIAREAETSEASSTRAQLLEGLLGRPVETTQPEVSKKSIGRTINVRDVGERIQRLLVALVLIGAVVGTLLPLEMGWSIPSLTQPLAYRDVYQLYDAIQGMGTGDAMLVAFEYGPAEADELDLVAKPVLQHAFDQGASISVVSTRPEGLTVAEGVLSAIAPPEEERFTLYGYAPGDALGVSQLLSELGPDHQIILVLTARPGPLRWWIEQANATTLPGADAPPVAAGLSAALEPIASPYLDPSAGQLVGAINGVSGAAAYETRSAAPDRATRQLTVLAAGHTAIVCLIVIGGIFYALSGLRRRKQ